MHRYNIVELPIKNINLKERFVRDVLIYTEHCTVCISTYKYIIIYYIIKYYYYYFYYYYYYYPNIFKQTNKHISILKHIAGL